MMIFRRFFAQHAASTRKICIIGAGPAGFYAAQQITKKLQNFEIDILEKLPVPFGLVRYGVAPDHPEVKNVINTFTKTAEHPSVRFFGNVDLGTDVTLKELREFYHVVVLCYGAGKDRTFNIPGEDLPNVLSARDLVGWYNGVPWCRNLEVDLNSSDTAAVLGQGNVAVDVARILLSPVDRLRKTDITEHALETLSRSRIRRVFLIGRRGPLQAAFTIKELREMLRLPGCVTHWRTSDLEGVENELTKLARPRRRLTELMLTSAGEQKPQNNVDREFLPVFYRSPLEFLPSKDSKNVQLGALHLAVNTLDPQTLKAVPSPNGDTETLECGLAVRSIGYQSVPADLDIPFDGTRGVVAADGASGRVGTGLYCTGWLSTGPQGVILNTMQTSMETANAICTYLDRENTESIAKEEQKQEMKNVSKPGRSALEETLRSRAVRTVTWSGWQRIDSEEVKRGTARGKPREKIVDVEEMLQVAGV